MKSFKEIYKYIAYEELGGIKLQNGNKYIIIDCSPKKDFVSIYINEGIKNGRINIGIYRSDLIHDTIMRICEYMECKKYEAYNEIRTLKNLIYILYGI